MFKCYLLSMDLQRTQIPNAAQFKEPAVQPLPARDVESMQFLPSSDQELSSIDNMNLFKIPNLFITCGCCVYNLKY